ncbi:MAG: energy transducer TonB, partial [Terriglobales bacterium]
AITAWYRPWPRSASKAATVNAPMPVAPGGNIDVAAPSDTNTTATPIEAPLSSVGQTLPNQTPEPAGIAPSQSAAAVPIARLPIETPAAIISPLEPKTIELSNVNLAPVQRHANQTRNKEDRVVANLREGQVQQETPRIQFSGPPRRLIYPDYPDTKVRGRVSLKAVIGTDGRVREVEILSGNKVLSAAAARAIRQWQYDPFYKDGQRVETETNVGILFVAADVISISFPQSPSAISQ